LRDLPPTEDALGRWKREAEARRERIRERRLTDAEAARLERGISEQIAVTREYMRDLVDTAIEEIASVTGELAKEHDEAIKRLDGELGALRADIEILRPHDAGHAENVVGLARKGA
jgi:hypothetical protein